MVTLSISGIYVGSNWYGITLVLRSPWFGTRKADTLSSSFSERHKWLSRCSRFGLVVGVRVVGSRLLIGFPLAIFRTSSISRHKRFQWFKQVIRCIVCRNAWLFRNFMTQGKSGVHVCGERSPFHSACVDFYGGMCRPWLVDCFAQKGNLVFVTSEHSLVLKY